MATTKIVCSTELMSNYKQAEVMAPDSKFEALQASNGNALLFSIGTDGAFYLTQETPGQKAGWQKTNLSPATANGAPPAKASTFSAAQNGNTIDLALAMTAPQNDTLYLSTGNSTTDYGWVKQPNWVPVPFDDLAHPLSKVVIKNIFMSEGSDGEHLVVDVLRDPSSAVPVILRYFIDSGKTLTGQAWNPHDVAGDLEAATVSSCLGRRTGDRVDGIYTAGSIDNQPQLLFQPLYNAFNPKIPANPVRLTLPAGVIGSALVAVSTGDDTTDLFVSAGQTIYYFPAGAQHDGDAGIALLNNPLYADIRSLFGFGTASEIILWGQNRANQIFYTRCARSQVGNASSWGSPIPICTGAEQVSPYVNRANNANTFFVHTGINQLQRASQAPDTSMWKFENILLPAAPDVKSIKMSSYTTRIQVVDSANKPLAGAGVQISAQHRVGVYVNGLYYVIDSNPIAITADAVGALTIVEWVDNLRGTPLTVTVKGADNLAINPMTKVFSKASALSDAGSLRSAQITGQNGSSRPLVPASVSDEDLKLAASALGQLNTVYQTVPADGSLAPAKVAAASRSAAPRFQAMISLAVAPGQPLSAAPLAKFDNLISSAAGDVLNWLEGAANYVVHIVKDAASDVWHFVVEIAGSVYSFLLDAADKVVGALEAIYRAIKTAIEDLIAFLEFLFEWKSFVRTKDVCKKLLLLSFDVILDGMGTLKSDLNQLIGDTRAKVDGWANVKADTWQGGVEHSDHSMSYMRSVTDVAEVLTAPAMFLYQHFMENVGGSKGTVPSSTGTGSNLLDLAVAGLDNEADIVIDAIQRIKSELIDGSAFDSLSLGDILKKLAAIVIDAFLNTSENLIDSLIDVLVVVARAGIEALDTPIWIPVLSDILADFGVSINFSLLDVIMMVAAVPATIGYKLATGSAPFSSDDGFSDKVIAANNLNELASAFGSGTHPAPLAAHAYSLKLAASDAASTSVGFASLKIQLSSSVARTIYSVGHAVAGVGGMISGVLSAGLATGSATGEDYDRSLSVSGIVTGISAALASIFESPMPIQAPDMYRMATATSVLTLVNKAAGWYVPRKLFGDNPTAAQTSAAKKVSTGLDAVIAFLALTPSCFHFQELAGEPAGSPRSSAIVGEVGNITNNLNRMVTFFVTIDEEPESRAILAGVACALMFLYAGLQFAEAAISPTQYNASNSGIRALGSRISSMSPANSTVDQTLKTV